MKKLIIVCIILLTPFILQAQEYSGEYKVVCKRIEGCPVKNGTCPTCTIVGGGIKRITNAEIDAWGKQLREDLKFLWEDSHENDDTPKNTGWGWDGPTWNGLWVLY